MRTQSTRTIVTLVSFSILAVCGFAALQGQPVSSQGSKVVDGNWHSRMRDPEEVVASKEQYTVLVSVRALKASTKLSASDYKYSKKNRKTEPPDDKFISIALADKLVGAKVKRDISADTVLTTDNVDLRH